MGITFTAELTGIDEDIEKLALEVKSAMKPAMRTLADDMIVTLGEHIVSDVYNALSGGPREYVRRYASGGLIDMNENLQGGDVQVTDDSAKMIYTPSGDSSQWKSPAYGDEMIRRIETKNPPYEWKRRPAVPARPFFTNFVNEMMETAEETLVNAMNRTGNDLQMAADGNLTKDASDWGG